jgi:POT family proton-dependent oligopeptide transporter
MSSPVRSSSLWSYFADRRFTTLFVTDLWERFSFFGMQALLFLYAVAPASSGGLGLGVGTGGALFGLYMSAVFLAGLPGGWVGDRVLGPRRALLYGALCIALGHYCLAVPARPTFYLGLACIAAGTGLMKPNLPVMFGAMYPRASSAQREAAFAIFYMSIQVSALLAPLVTGLLGERVNWHLGFGTAAVGMTVAIVRYVAGLRHFGDEGSRPPNPATPAQRSRMLRRAGTAAGAAVALLTVDAVAGSFHVEHLLGLIGLVSLVAPVAYFRYLLRRPGFNLAERVRIRSYVWVLLASALFWMMYSQLGSSFAFFAREYTDRTVLGFTVPASWFQSAHPLFLLVVAPMSAWLWMRLGTRVGAGVKLAGGLLASGVGFTVMTVAALLAVTGTRVSPGWLLVAFLAQSCGEITFGPVGLSVTTEVAPAGYRSQLMGLYFLGAALGAAVGGQFSRLLGTVPLPVYFAVIAFAGLLGAAVLAARAGRIGRALSVGLTAARTVEPVSRAPQAVVASLSTNA